MKLSILLLALSAAFGLAGPAAAGCYADYKAKRDAPLQLHYGVAELPDSACSPAGAAAELGGRLAGDGWQLLTIVSVFDDAGLDARRDAAGAYFLRY